MHVCTVRSATARSCVCAAAMLINLIKFIPHMGGHRAAQCAMALVTEHKLFLGTQRSRRAAHIVFARPIANCDSLCYPGCFFWFRWAESERICEPSKSRKHGPRSRSPLHCRLHDGYCGSLAYLSKLRAFSFLFRGQESFSVAN